MAYHYKLTPLAVTDIDEALDYISKSFLNPNAADRLYHALRKEIKSICSRPYAFPNCSYYLIDDKNIRHSLVGSYVLIYEVSPTEEVIKILRFLYGGRNISDMNIPE